MAVVGQECKKFSKELRVLDKETRAWDAYNGAENAVKNMMTSLRAVGELQNPSIRDRHWTQLMQATGVSPHHVPLSFLLHPSWRLG